MLSRKILESLVYSYLGLSYLYNQEKEYKNNVNKKNKIWCLLNGFSSEKYELYNFQKNDYKQYLSDYQRRKAAMINNRYSIILSDKNIFAKLLKGENITAKSYGAIKVGEIFLYGKKVTFNEFIKFLEFHNKVIIKMYNGGGGKNVYKLELINEELVLNDNIISKERLILFLEGLDNYLVDEHLNQADYSSKIYPGTVNTIRILTMIDPDTDEVIIPVAVHKFGSEKTKPADNVWKGGMTALVDIETGILKKSALHHTGNKKISWENLHPDTKVQIEGTVIPNWNDVKNELIRVAKSVSFLKYVGWDVVITTNGIKIIEGNSCSDVNILQIHHPLLTDDRVRKFYKYHNIIK